MNKELIVKYLGNTLNETNIAELGRRHKGKVRDVYVSGEKIFLVTTDRVSAFDVVLGTIPFKGQVLNQIANYWFGVSKDIVPNHIIDTPDPNVTVVRRCEALPVEMVVRGYITGSLWREYEKGERNLYGLGLPEGVKRDQAFDAPVITPTTKAAVGEHDLPLSPSEVVEKGLIPARLWDEICEKAVALFKQGTKLAAEKGLILVDTKYEFGLLDGKLTLIDEVHTPDSSRYWVADGYRTRFETGQDQQMLDKENLRQWLIARGYSGQGTPPVLTDEVRTMLATKYIDLYERMTGKKFEFSDEPIAARLVRNLKTSGYLS